MKANRFHKFELKPIPGAKGRVSAGGNMRVLVDGKRMKGITKATFDVKAGGIATVKLEAVGIVNATMWALGSPFPYKVKTKKKTNKR